MHRTIAERVEAQHMARETRAKRSAAHYRAERRAYRLEVAR